MFFVFFHVGNLNLKIPWKNLYTQPVEAVLEDIYLLIVPSSSKSNLNSIVLVTVFVHGKLFLIYSNNFGEFFDFFSFFLFFWSSVLLGPHLRYMEVPGLGI